MNTMQIFNFENNDVRTHVINDEPWFVGKDVAEVLGYSNTRDALNKHVDDEDKNTVAIHDGTSGNPNQTIINESGLYSLVFKSHLPQHIRVDGPAYRDRRKPLAVDECVRAGICCCGYVHG